MHCCATPSAGHDMTAQPCAAPPRHQHRRKRQTRGIPLLPCASPAWPLDSGSGGFRSESVFLLDRADRGQGRVASAPAI